MELHTKQTNKTMVDLFFRFLGGQTSLGTFPRIATLKDIFEYIELKEEEKSGCEIELVYHDMYLRKFQPQTTLADLDITDGATLNVIFVPKGSEMPESLRRILRRRLL
eukprot:TRINITY_DN4442_c0_g1_i2.p1 TRINITY_DN4442_c0_g1~~TRINITY_DN4442_c0_g1_i2.p1  ORF type:complete len:108 (-),score=12.93 TRINITY_DN4442_c0_g1_i2:253-576(-)